MRENRSLPDRRSFLASACALPVALHLLSAPPVWAEEGNRQAPYLKLAPYLQPGHDEFPEEQAAIEAEAALHQALSSGTLPLATACEGKSPLPKSWKQISASVSEAVFDGGSSDVQAGFGQWLQTLGTIRRAKFFVLPSDLIRFEVAATREGKLAYHVGHWNARWQNAQLTNLSPRNETRAVTDEPWFRDVTGHVFENCPAFANQLARGVPYWRARLDPATGIDIYGNNGISVGDIDNDGVDEVFVCQPGGLPNRLFKYRGGRLEDISDAWGVGLLDDTSAALFLDLRNTGRQDLVVLRSAGPLLYLNEGSLFRLRDDAFRFATAPQGGFTGMAAADYNRDGKLDLYLCTYVYFQSEAQYTYPTPYHDARNGPPNFLFRNVLSPDGSGSFEDVTKDSGMDQNNNRFSFAPAWCDYDGDGWPDLYVANDFGCNNLYRNEKVAFRDVAAEAGVEDLGPGMSASWFDYDRDGRPDLYVANMWSSSGQRILRSPKFAPAQGPGMAEAYRRHTEGNSLFHNEGENKFSNVTAREGAGMGRWAWSSGGHDLDNDGWPEILVTCGMLTNVSEEDRMSFFWRQVVSRSPQKAQPSAAYENGWGAINQFIREDQSWNGREPNMFYARREGRYYDLSGISGFDYPEDSRAFAVTDFDGDGRVDILLKSRLGPQVRVLQNNCAAVHHSIAFDLRGTNSNRDAIGAKIEADGRTVWLDAGNGYLSQHSKRITIGLGKANRAQHVRITWPSGLMHVLPPLDAGYVYAVEEGSAEIAKRAFETPRMLPEQPFRTDNQPRLHTTWLLAPIPLPEPRKGPGLLVLQGPEARREIWQIFRRYLFDWRTSLVPPLALLLDSEGRAVKVYDAVPGGEIVEADLELLSRGGTAQRLLHLALPLGGAFQKQPRRDYFKFGAALLWAGHNEQALPYLEEVLSQSPTNARVLLLVGQIHLQAGRAADAEKFLQRALAANPAYADAWSEMGGVYESRQDFQQALACYEKAISLKPDLPYALLNAAQASQKIGAMEKAEEYYRRALAADSQSPEAANGLGLLLARRGQTDQAKQFLQQAISLKRDYASAINNLGVLYLDTGRVEDAIAAFNYGIRAAPDDDMLYLNLGRIYARNGQKERAREVMQSLIDRKPDSATAKRALEELERRP